MVNPRLYVTVRARHHSGSCGLRFCIGSLELLVLFSVSFAFQVTLCKDLLAQPIAFVNGDSAFPAIVHRISPFLLGKSTLNATKIAGWLDHQVGSTLSLADLPPIQLESARSLALQMMNASAQDSVLLFVVDEKFDVSRHWLGIPYNAKRFRIPDGTVCDPCFGPSGSATISKKDSHLVPPLGVEIQGDQTHRVKGSVLLVLVPIKHANDQKVRLVVNSNGSMSNVKFDYNPTHRVCFEEGDAFFLGDATPIFEGIRDDVTLTYEVSPRHFQYFIKEGTTYFTEEEIDRFVENLPILEKGRTLMIQSLPISKQRQILKLLPPKRRDQDWFVFVVEKDYDPVKYGTGYRYNSLPFDARAKRPLDFEYVDCLFWHDRFPRGDDEKAWPKSLKVTWNDGMACVSLDEVRLVFVSGWSGVHFFGKPEGRFGQLSDGKFQIWDNANCLETYVLD